MANMILATPVISDAATISSSQVAASLPLKNLKRSAIGACTRFLTPASAHILIDLGENPASINLIALLAHNASIQGKAQVRAANDLASLTAAASYDSGIIPLRSNLQSPDYEDVGSLKHNHFILHLDAAEQLRFWRIDLMDVGVAYLDIGRLYLAKAFQPSVNMDYGMAEGVIDPSSIQRTVSGRVIPNERPKYRFAELTLSFGTKEEMLGVAADIDSNRGNTKDVLLVLDYDDKPLLQKRSIYGRLASLTPVVHAYFGLFEKSYRIEEIVA